jgi:deazaflavin-dependent oxidoreductase (nitroreductase family)
MSSSMTEAVVDCTVDWVAAHLRAYVDSRGLKGHRRGGRRALLVTTRGRRSGMPRRVALYYGRDGDRYVLVASHGGARLDPLWYRNLLADPRVVLQVGPEVFEASARPATSAERAGLWQLMVAIFPYYEGYQAKTRREIPVVIVERVVSGTTCRTLKPARQVVTTLTRIHQNGLAALPLQGRGPHNSPPA